MMGTAKVMRDRTMAIGLDGMPKSLLYQLTAEGVMPNLAALIARNGCMELRAPVPEISSTAWATFLTGVNPGRHGIYGFIDLKPGGYRTYFPRSGDLRAPPMWTHLDRQGYTTLCLNVPGTYPAPRIHGTLVSGFVAPSLEKAVHPSWLAEPLRQMDYELDVEVGDVASDPGAFVARVRRSLTARTRVFRHLLTTQPWDLAVVVFTATDRLQHYLWRAVATPSDPLHVAVMDFYRAVDNAVGEVLGCAGSGVRPVVVSDHGFGPAHCQFYVNAWLRERGYLSPLDDIPTLADLDGSSRAFALDPARIYLHRADRFPRGSLSDDAAAQISAQLAMELRALRWSRGDVGPHVDGPPVFDEVWHRDEIYHGPLIEHAPDLVAVPARGVQARGSWLAREVTAPDVLTGTHTRTDAVLSVPGSIAGLAEMTDVAPTLLASIGVHPTSLDGVDVARPAAAESMSTP
jgi:predicted AlkP superfamily phosphohydrolase/phosphomutase